MLKIKKSEKNYVKIEVIQPPQIQFGYQSLPRAHGFMIHQPTRPYLLITASCVSLTKTI